LLREADVRDGTVMRSAIDDCAVTMGGIDVVVANAAIEAGDLTSS
jgi:NAD(P)-dependent dehydrogenase (short-subunit alcohol dehydrogenase family)